MKKEMALQQNNSQILSAKEVSNLFSAIKSKEETVTEWFRNYYGSILERPLSKTQAGAITRTNVAFALMLLPTTSQLSTNLFLHAATLGWFAYNLWRCKKLLKQHD